METFRNDAGALKAPDAALFRRTNTHSDTLLIHFMRIYISSSLSVGECSSTGSVLHKQLDEGDSEKTWHLG